MNMKRILLITENLGSGGAERQICGLAVMLTKVGYPCRLITYVESQFYEPYLRQNEVDYQFVPELWCWNTRVFRMAKYVQQYKADIVISFLPSVNISMCLAKLFCKAKLVVSERNNNTCITQRDRMTFNLYRMADAIVPNSNSQGEFIRKNFSFLSNKVYPIINFVDVNRFTPAGKLNNGNKLRLITVARYAPQKNVLAFLYVVRAIKNLNLNIRFDWFGSRYNYDYYSQVEKVYMQLDISDYLTLHDQSKNIENEYRKSDFLILPSLYEGYPNVIVEAMSCGLPIICSNKYENPYIVKEDINGFLFDPENIKDMTSAICKAYSMDIEQRINMGQINRRYCLKNNTEEIFLKAYIKLFERI